MEHQIYNKKDFSIIKLNGELSQENSIYIDKVIKQGYKKGSDVILDLGDVTYINSVVIGLFMGLYNKMNENLDKIAVGNSNQLVEDSFELIGISKIIKILGDNNKAQRYIEEFYLNSF